MQKVKDHPNLYRDPDSGAIIVKDSSGLELAIAAKQRQEQQQQDISDLKHEIQELKKLLKEMADNGSN